MKDKTYGMSNSWIATQPHASSFNPFRDAYQHYHHSILSEMPINIIIKEIDRLESCPNSALSESISKSRNDSAKVSVGLRSPPVTGPGKD